MAAVWYHYHPEDKAIFDAEFKENDDESKDEDMNKHIDENE
jgi:cbb3-type cytochrome oxidase subunit 3